MIACFACLGSPRRFRILRSQFALAGSFIAVVLAGCGGGSGGTNSGLRGNTTVVVLASSTANDQLVEFPLTLKNLTLTSESGKTVTLFAGPLSAEYMHLNGNLEPLATVSIPQGIYTSASAVLDGTSPVCVGLDLASGQILIDGSLNGPGTPSATVDLPQPITVTGSAMGLVLDLQVSPSAPFSGGCAQALTFSVPIAPKFDLKPLVIAAQPTNTSNGKVVGLVGTIAAVGATGNQFTVSAPYGYGNGNPPRWQVSTNGSTVFQGIGSASGLVNGMPVDMDLALQQDGTLMAKRISVYDSDTTSLSLSSGHLLNSGPAPSAISGLTAQYSGDLPQMSDEFGYGNANFGVSDQFTNLQSLPFSANFGAANVVVGQNVLVTSNAPLVNGFPPLPLPATTMRLMPQTINATVTAISRSGGFNIFTVTLAPYDLFPNLAARPGQPALLTNPNTVLVYADSNTQILNSNSVSAGGVFRFYGLVFNDGGTLRMDCAQIREGVAE